MWLGLSGQAWGYIIEFQTKEKRGEPTCCSLHDTGSRLPIQLNEQRQSPRKYEYTKPYIGFCAYAELHTSLRENRGCENSHPWDIYRCFLWLNKNLRDSCRQSKALDKRLCYVWVIAYADALRNSPSANLVIIF